MSISPARVVAFDILLNIEAGQGHSSYLLNQFADSLDERDRSLCHELVFGVLRRQIYLDRQIGQVSGSRKLDVEVRIAIRLGLYQLFYLNRVPDYSAVGESVELMSRAKKSSAKGFVNAVLRRASRGIAEIVYSDELDRLSVETSHPPWLIRKWISRFGFDGAVALCHANNEKPPVAFRPTAGFYRRKGRVGRLEALKECRRSQNVEECLIAQRITAELRSLETAGEIYFQDEGSQLVADAVELSENEALLDLCAAPGSKTTAIAARCAARGSAAMIVAADSSMPRVSHLKGNCIVQGAGEVECIRLDGLSGLPFGNGTFDKVLLDAPCSGTGTIRHNPEIRYRLAPNDLVRFAVKQEQMLRNCARLVRPGGRLIYSTCSLENEENENVVNSFLVDDDLFLPERPKVPDRFVTPEGFASTFPHRDNMDGFFIAVLEKSSQRI
jgi:16S rRNA (cytosine967-C5)-methyltransferase